MIERLSMYVKNTGALRYLSTPSLQTIDSPWEYEKVLRENFRKIGEIAEENRAILSEVLLPILEDGHELNEQEIQALYELCNQLIYGEEMENLDIPLGNMISAALWKRVQNSDDIEFVLQVADLHATTCYLMMNYSKRSAPFSTIYKGYREEGIRMCNIIWEHLEYEKWMALPNDSVRKMVLDLARYKSIFYETKENDPVINDEEIAILDRVYEMGQDPRYIDIFDQEEKVKYFIRLAAYYGYLLEAGNRRGFSYTHSRKIQKRTAMVIDLWEKYPEICAKYSTYDSDIFFYYRSSYFAGELSPDEYKEKMMELYQKRSVTNFELEDVYMNLLLPIDYMKLMNRKQLSEADLAILEQFYNNATNYIFQLPNNDFLIYTLEYLGYLISEYLEIPGGESFEEFGLNCFAALHPPTYVHSQMVAVITRCLCKHLLRSFPEYFLDFCGETDKNHVIDHRDEIMDYAYHSALCHDFGKLAIMDTVFVYGRNIMDCEFSQIKSHPELGARYLEHHASTAKYVNVAKGHHKWYDDSKGYPFQFETAGLPEKVIIDLVCCADCMDAATDTAGRSYNKGKTLEQYIAEVEEGAGTRYASYLVELLQKDEVIADLKYILSDTRNMIYRDAFIKLRKLQRMGTEKN